ncbi:MAG: hypothetical protein WC346_12410 [Methanogenium sp.]|jgi:hypothetical protein
MLNNKKNIKKKKTITTKNTKVKQLTKKERVLEEEKRLRESFENLSDKKILNIVDGLIIRASYMRVQLEIYENDLTEKGYIELFSQSEDLEPYERERPVARLYNALNKNYQTIIKQLIDLIPKNIQEDDDGFEDFCKE